MKKGFETRRAKDLGKNLEAIIVYRLLHLLEN